jgi:hypothetical protein
MDVPTAVGLSNAPVFGDKLDVTVNRLSRSTLYATGMETIMSTNTIVTIVDNSITPIFIIVYLFDLGLAISIRWGGWRGFTGWYDGRINRCRRGTIHTIKGCR